MDPASRAQTANAATTGRRLVTSSFRSLATPAVDTQLRSWLCCTLSRRAVAGTHRGIDVTSSSSFPRRSFLAASGVVTGLLAAGGPLSLIAPSRAWALEVRALTSSQGATLLSVARTIAPHDGLEDAAYALVVKALDAAMAADEHTRASVVAGLAALGDDFASRSEAARTEALKAAEGSEFFRLVRSATLANLYSSPLAYAHFGYQGEAFTKGGYLTRGFDELDWLPDVPLDDSGPNPGRAAR